MSGFTAEALEKKLCDLNNSQQSIQTLSLWLIHHRKHHKGIVNTWFKELRKAKQNRKLTFMYLANDVIQNSRKKGPEFTKEFGTVLKQAFDNVSKDIDEKTLSGLNRILTVWGERNIYDSSQITAFKQALGVSKNISASAKNDNNTIVASKTHNKKDNHQILSDIKERVSKKRELEKDKNKDASKHGSKRHAVGDNKNVLIQKQDKPRAAAIVTVTEKKQSSGVHQNSTVPHVDADILIKKLQDLENSASSDAAVREKIASLPPEVSDATLLDKIRDKGAAEKLSKHVDDACTILADYNSRLSQELEDRKHISSLLTDYTQNQRDAQTLAEQKLGEYKDKLRKVIQVRNELKSHLQNLPDLSRLPSVTGLAPLPSACDLFARANAHPGSLSSSASPNESTASPADYETLHGTPGSNTS